MILLSAIPLLEAARLFTPCSLNIDSAIFSTKNRTDIFRSLLLAVWLTLKKSLLKTSVQKHTNALFKWAKKSCKNCDACFNNIPGLVIRKPCMVSLLVSCCKLCFLQLDQHCCKIDWIKLWAFNYIVNGGYPSKYKGMTKVEADIFYLDK